MPRLDNQQVILGLRNASDDALLYVCKRYFQSVRRWIRKKGVPDARTQFVFSKMLTGLVRNIQEKRLSGPVDFEALLRDVIDDGLSSFKKDKNSDAAPKDISASVEVAARCYSALDPTAGRLLEAYYLEGLNFEELASRFGYGNATIAEFEVLRQMAKLEGLVHISLEK
ncbi:MAG: hypothetical protein ACKOKF_00360 [Bacteroidota bacterium]